jgi:hypothetical protein
LVRDYRTTLGLEPGLEPGLDWGVWSRGWSWGEARVRQGWGRVGGVSKQEVIDEMLLMENPLLQEFR